MINRSRKTDVKDCEWLAQLLYANFRQVVSEILAEEGRVDALG